VWLRPDGQEMDEADWSQGYLRALGIVLAGDAIEETDARGNRIVDDTFLLLLNAHHEAIPFLLPSPDGNASWSVVLNTHVGGIAHPASTVTSGEPFTIEPRSMALLCRPFTISS